MCWSKIGDGGMADDVISIGHNFETVLNDLETRMREARRRRFEFRGSRKIARRSKTPARHRTRRGRRSHRQAARSPRQSRRLCRRQAIRRIREPAAGFIEARRQQHAAFRWFNRRRRLFTLPWEGGETSEARSRGRAPQARGCGVSSKGGASRVHKPHLDEMHGPESLPYRPRPRLPTQTRARRHRPRQQNHPAHRLAPIRPGVRTDAPLQRRRAGASGWVEEAVSGPPSLS